MPVRPVDTYSEVANAAFGGTPSTRASRPVVGVFDSGIGGLSVLRALRSELPGADMHYVADGAYAPYGERGDDYVVARSLRIAGHLVATGASLLVVACNTATAAAVQVLRASWPGLPVVGVEPGIKPAVAATRNRRIGVLATPGTLASDKFRQLLLAQSGDVRVLLQPCPGLAALIERVDADSTEMADAVRAVCRPLSDGDVDTVVLGCTHYPFIRHVIAREMGPGVAIVDTAQAVARRAGQLLEGSAAAWSFGREAATVRVETTGEPETIVGAVAMMCGGAVDVAHVALAPTVAGIAG